MYIPYKSAHPRHTIKNYVLGELKRYVRINTEELNYQKIKNSFFLRMRNRGFNKNVLAKWFSQVKYSNRAKFLDGNPDDTCYYQGTRETLADTNLIKIGRVLWRKLWVPIPKKRRKSFQRTRIQRLLRRHQHVGLFYSSEGSFNKRVVCPLLKAKMKKQKTSACMTVLSSEKQKGCAASSQNQSWKFAKSTKSSRKK